MHGGYSAELKDYLDGEFSFKLQFIQGVEAISTIASRTINKFVGRIGFQHRLT